MQSTSHLRNQKRNPTNEETASIVANTATIKHNATNFEKIDTTKLKRKMAFPTPMTHPNLNATHEENFTKQKTAGTELMRRTTPGRNVTNSQSPPAKSANNQSPLLKSSQKTKNAAPPLRGNGRREGVHNRRPLKSLRKGLHDRMQRKTDTGLATLLEYWHDPQTQRQAPGRSNTTPLVDHRITGQLRHTKTTTIGNEN